MAELMVGGIRINDGDGGEIKYKYKIKDTNIKNIYKKIKYKK